MFACPAYPCYPDLIYPIDYGYLAGTSAMDGGGIDVWCGTGTNGVDSIAVIVGRLNAGYFPRASAAA